MDCYTWSLPEDFPSCKGIEMSLNKQYEKHHHPEKKRTFRDFFGGSTIVKTQVFPYSSEAEGGESAQPLGKDFLR